MRMSNHIEHIFKQVVLPETMNEIITEKSNFFGNTPAHSRVHHLVQLICNGQIELDKDFLQFLSDDELFELGFQFGFEGKYNRWQMIDDINIWFENNFDVFIDDRPMQVPDVNCSHTELIDWLGELTFNELQKICHILNTKYRAGDYFHNLCQNQSIDQIMHKLNMVNKELLHKVILFYYQQSSYEEAEQQELNLESSEDTGQLNMAYEILNVDRKATNADIKKSYFKLAKDYHPDRFATQDELQFNHRQILDNFNSVKQAFEIIKNSRPGPW